MGGDQTEGLLRTVLVVDHDMHMRRWIQRNLELSVPNVRVLTACDGFQGWQMFTTHHPDVVVTALMPGGLEGHELIRSIRATGGTTRILVLTSADPAYNRPKALAHGADAYMTKPAGPRELVQAVSALLADPRPERALGNR